jgi:hypothetical protein
LKILAYPPSAEKLVTLQPNIMVQQKTRKRRPSRPAIAGFSS